MARFEIDFLDEYTDEALLNEIKRIAALLVPGEPFTKTVYKQNHPKVSESTLCHRFGGWRETLEKAGLGDRYRGPSVSQKMRAQPAKGLSNDDLIAEVKRVHQMVGKNFLTSEDFSSHSVASKQLIQRRFGSFIRALEIAGVPHHPHRVRPFTDEECFENLAAVWTHYGRAPQYLEMFKPPSGIRAKTYVTRWRTWRKAMKAFVDWAQSDEPTATEVTRKPSSNPPSKPQTTAEDRRNIPLRLKWQVHLRDRFRCVACGRSPANDLSVELHADHIVPYGSGGKTVQDNLQTLCRDCNLGKGMSFGKAHVPGDDSDKLST